MTKMTGGDDTPRGWMPGHVRTYLAHVQDGVSIRELARSRGCHASTVLRQVRRCEQHRDDPLFDTALDRIGKQAKPEGTSSMSFQATDAWPDTATIETEARRILRRLAEPGACLAVADGMETAVVVREDPDGQTVRTGTVSTVIAEAMVLKGWIGAGAKGRVLRYRITHDGRTTLKMLLAKDESARVRAETEDDTPSRANRYGTPESPLLMLARRRDKDGSRFLSPELVRAGERLREDYEIAAMDGIPDAGWESLAAGAGAGDPSASGVAGAKARLSAALADLGPGLADVVLRVVCQLEGLEVTERRMGWAARSGKIVLRIGLQRLARHFETHSPAGGGMIG